MGEEGIAFHFPEPNSAVPLPAFDGLPRERVDGPNRAHLALVADLIPSQDYRHTEATVFIG